MPSVEVTRDRVQLYLTELGQVTLDGGTFSMRQGSTRVFVEVEELGDDHTWVRLFAPILLDVSLTPEVYEYVATSAAQYRVGVLSVTPDDDGTTGHLSLTYGLLGSHLDADELQVAVVFLLGSADELDDELQEKFGGRRLHEDE